MEKRGMKELLYQLPKVDLHVHLDGSVKPETLLELARRQGAELPAGCRKTLLPFMQVDESCGSLKEYLSKFDFVLPFLQTGEALERVACEIAEQAAEHNCRYVEVRFAPQLHRSGGLTAEETIRYVLAGLQRGERDYGVKSRAIAICMRHHGYEENAAVVQAAALYAGRGLAAVDLAGDEASFPPDRFRDVFSLCRELGIPVTIHAGEAGGAGNVYEAVTRLGASRIGHGVRLREDAAVLELVKERRVPLEMCPVSNIQTKAVADWHVYPIRDYFDRGLLITINTDNPIVSGTNITKEYEILAEKFNFTMSELAKLVMNGVEAAFLEDSEKSLLKRDVERELQELGIACG